MRGSGVHGTGGPDLRTVVDQMPVLLPTPTESDGSSSGGSSPSDVTLTDAIIRTDLGQQPNARHSTPQSPLLPTPLRKVAAGPSGAQRQTITLETLMHETARPAVEQRLVGDLPMLPTPTVHDQVNPGPSQTERHTLSLSVLTHGTLQDRIDDRALPMLPTPLSSDRYYGGRTSDSRATQTHQIQLADIARHELNEQTDPTPGPPTGGGSTDQPSPDGGLW